MNDPWRVRVMGPLAAYAPDFREELFRRGYRRSPAAALLHLLAHLSCWLEYRGLKVEQLTPERVAQYVETRRSEGRSIHLSQRALVPLLEHLRHLDVLPAPARLEAVTPVAELLGRYRDHLVSRRNLSESTIRRYESVARRFLSTRRQESGSAMEELTVAEVMRFLARARPVRSSTFARIEIPALRSLLRFCHVEGLTALPLAQVVPAGGHGSDFLPRGLDPRHVGSLLQSCDRRNAAGRRDYAILTLLVRMGLRAGEVVALQLDDIDWQNGEILVRGKGRSRERLPLPTDVGEALAAYLQRGRPSGRSRALFLRVTAPHDGLAPTSLTEVVYRACDRAGLPRVGAHRLRHTAATAMLGSGAALSEIAQVLRHRSAATTAIYAKVDHRALQALAQPWPGGAA